MPDVARDPRLGVQGPVVVVGEDAAAVGEEPAAEQARVRHRVGGVERVVEEAELHRLEQPLGRELQLGPVLADHHQRDGQPGVVHGREEAAHGPAAGPLAQVLAGPRVVPVVEEPVRPLEPAHGGEHAREPLARLIMADEAEAVGRDRAPEVCGDVRRGRIGSGRPRLARAPEAVGRQDVILGSPVDRPPGRLGVGLEQHAVVAREGRRPGRRGVRADRQGDQRSQRCDADHKSSPPTAASSPGVERPAPPEGPPSVRRSTMRMSSRITTGE